MKMVNHTPGPWVNERMTEIQQVVGDEASRIDVYEITTRAKPYADFDTIAYVFDEKHAALIAAAPDLLEAVKSLLEIARAPELFTGKSVRRRQVFARNLKIAQAGTAIHKATGGQP